MRKLLLVGVLLALMTNMPSAQDASVNEVLAVVNGRAITYHEIVRDTDIQAEINAWRAYREINENWSDRDIERLIVLQRLGGYVLQKLLDAEAAKVTLRITDSQMRAVLQRERKGLGIDDDDTRTWALYLRERYNLSPSEYRVRRRQEIMRNEMMNYMAGAYGPLPPQWPVDTYFSLSVTPRDVRREFDKDREKYLYAYDIRYREFILKYPLDTAFAPSEEHSKRGQLGEAVRAPKTGVRARVASGETLEGASAGLKQLIKDLGIPGAEVVLTPEKVADDDSELDPTAYQMVLSLRSGSGVSEVGAYEETAEDGTMLGGLRFVQLISCRFGEQKVFDDPKVQEGIRQQLFGRRLNENRMKVEQELLRRAAIIPRDWFTR